jgi:NADH:ubiquinone oxidoreductase subunit 3 (subunit A)
MNPLGTAREKFSIQFFLIAILFIIFDLEVIFLFPFTISLYHTSIYGFWVVLIFLIILIIGFVYEFSKGALKFIPTKNMSITNLNSPSKYITYIL